MEVKNKINCYKRAPNVTLTGDGELYISDSDWSNKFIVLELGERKVMVKAAELKAAIQNATNTASLT